MELPVGDKGPEVKDNWVKFITQGGPTGSKAVIHASLGWVPNLL